MIKLDVEVNVDSMVAKIQEDLKKWLNDRNEIFLQRLLEEGKAVAGSLFGSAATLTIDKISNTTYSLTASGEAVCFIEFGTGVYADSSHAFANQMPFTIAPGSWSDTIGKGTWSAWVDSGKDPNDYPYNRRPKYPMWEAYKRMIEVAPQIATEVYR